MDQPEQAITNVATHVEREEAPWMMDVNDERRISAWIVRAFTVDQSTALRHSGFVQSANIIT